MAFAYRDKTGMLHCTDHKDTAYKYAAGGKVVEYNGLCSGGYPLAGIEINDYGNGEIYVGGNKKSGTKLGQCEPVVRKAVQETLSKITI